MPLPLQFTPVPLSATIKVVETQDKSFYALCYKEQTDSETERYLRVDPVSGQVLTGDVSYPKTARPAWQYKQNGWTLPPKPAGTDWHRAALNAYYWSTPRSADVMVRAFFKGGNASGDGAETGELEYVCWATIDGQNSYATTSDKRYFICKTMEQNNRLVLVDNPPAV